MADEPSDQQAVPAEVAVPVAASNPVDPRNVQNFDIDHRAVPLTLGVISIVVVGAVLLNWMVSYDMPPGAPGMAAVDGLSKGQAALIEEVNRQLKVWLRLARNYDTLALVMGASAAALTVIVGFIKEHTKTKMFLMALSAALSVFIGTVNPGEKATRFINSWRALYLEVNLSNGKTKLGDDDFKRVATALSAAESALSGNRKDDGKTGDTDKGN